MKLGTTTVGGEEGNVVDAGLNGQKAKVVNSLMDLGFTREQAEFLLKGPPREPDVETEKGSRDYLKSLVAQEEKKEEAIRTRMAAIREDVNLVARVTDRFRDNTFTTDRVVRELFPVEVSCIESNAAAKAEQKMLPKAALAAVIGVLYGALLGHLSGRKAGIEIGKRGMPLKQKIAEGAVNWGFKVLGI